MKNQQKMKSYLSMIAFGVSVTIALTGCVASNSPNGNPTEKAGEGVVQELRAMLPDEIRERGTILAVTDPSQMPYEGTDENDKIVGIDPDIAAAVEEVLGVKFDWARTDFAGLITGITTKRYDVSIEAMWDTEKRRQQVDFVDTLISANNIVVAKGNPLKITDLSGLCGQNVSTLEGSLMTDLMDDYQSKCATPINIMIAPTTADQLLWLSTGRAVATIANPIVTQYSLDTGASKDVEVVQGEGYLKNNYGWAFHKDNSKLRDAIAHAIQYLMDNGRYGQIMDNWNVSQNSRLTAVEINSEPFVK